MRKAFAWAMPVLLAGCATAPLPPQAGHVNLGQVKLTQTVTIEANSARAFVQDGHVVTQPDSRDPVCVFQSWQSKDQPQTITPEAFTVADVTHRRGEVGSGFGVYGGTDMGVGIHIGMGSFDDPVQPSSGARFGAQARLEQGATILRLVSARQPLVYKLVCFSAAGVAPFAPAPTVNDMNHILGDIAHVELATKE